MHPTTYSIQQVSDITGLSKQVIRKWEDRYALIQPERMQNGYRVYTQYEIQLLQQVIELTEDGHSVKKAVQMVKQSPPRKQENHSENPVTASFVDALVDAGQNLHEEKLMSILEQAHHLFGIDILFKEIIRPFLIRVGELWCEKEWGEFQEAVSSQTIRDFLANVRRQFHLPATAPLVLGSCLPNERHEISIQLLLIQCMLKGYRTLMLGPAPAPKAIQSAVLTSKPSLVLLSGSTEAIWFDQGHSLTEIDTFAQTMPDVTFFIGGVGVKDLLAPLHLQAIHEAHSLEDVFEQLERIQQ